MNSESGPGVVYFAAQDYAGFWRRLAVELVDIVVVIILSIAVVLLVALTAGDQDISVTLLLFSWVLVVYWYFVVLKHTGWLTVGYRVCRVRIVDVHGQAPGLMALTLRFLFAMFGPVNFLFDILWIPSDARRQSLRDKFAHTYVVKAGAKPVGAGHIVYRNYHILGSTFIFQEVEPAKVADVS